MSRTRWTTSATGTRVPANELMFRHRMCRGSRGRLHLLNCLPHLPRPRLGIRNAMTDISKTGICRSSGSSRIAFWARLLTRAARDITYSLLFDSTVAKATLGSQIAFVQSPRLASSTRKVTTATATSIHFNYRWSALPPADGCGGRSTCGRMPCLTAGSERGSIRTFKTIPASGVHTAARILTFARPSRSIPSTSFRLARASVS